MPSSPLSCHGRPTCGRKGKRDSHGPPTHDSALVYHVSASQGGSEGGRLLPWHEIGRSVPARGGDRVKQGTGEAGHQDGSCGRPGISRRAEPREGRRRGGTCAGRCGAQGFPFNISSSFCLAQTRSFSPGKCTGLV